ncbi:hypothetical protein DPMN_110646 [Dreissena polymorpha]|uniref:Uncharacterized protein n=1 Tax=Dreissena polymorpha TaxID=45954 RepID=A0A9D4KCG1_DREPO|nr:hypothetical protein DPMN_110646 [Dreissena polymorpha]
MINSPTPGDHVFEQTGTIFELIQYLNQRPTSLFKHNNNIKTRFLTKWHKDWAINVTFRVLSSKMPRHPAAMKNAAPHCGHVYIIRTNVPNKFHEDWTINATFRVYDVTPPGGHVFQPTGNISRLVQYIIGTNLLTKFQEDRTMKFPGTVVKETEKVFELDSPGPPRGNQEDLARATLWITEREKNLCPIRPKELRALRLPGSCKERNVFTLTHIIRLSDVRKVVVEEAVLLTRESHSLARTEYGELRMKGWESVKADCPKIKSNKTSDSAEDDIGDRTGKRPTGDRSHVVKDGYGTVPVSRTFSTPIRLEIAAFLERGKGDCKILENKLLEPFLPPVIPSVREWNMEYVDAEILDVWRSGKVKALCMAANGTSGCGGDRKGGGYKRVQDIIGSNLLTKFNDDGTILWPLEKNATPPPPLIMSK